MFHFNFTHGLVFGLQYFSADRREDNDGWCTGYELFLGPLSIIWFTGISV